MEDELNFDDLLDLDDSGLIDFDRTTLLRAPFGMVGAKWRSLDNILPKLPFTRDSIWNDVCGGTGVLSWNVPECKVMVFNDRYSGIVDFYRCLQSNQQELVTELESYPPHSRQYWTDCKLEWNTETDPVKRAAKWFYMSKLSVLYKRKAFGRGINTRFMPLHPSLKIFESIHHVLKNFYLENLDLRVCLKDYDKPKTIHYIDPPYVGTDQGTYDHKWTWDDMKDLFRLIPTLDGFVAFSHYPDPRIDELPFWTRKYQWEVNVTAEPLAFHESNQKAGKEDVTNVDTAIECLWIKDV